MFGAGFVKATGNHQYRIVRLVITLIKRPQPVDVDVFHIAAGANRILAVVVPQIGGGSHALQQDGETIVFAAFHLVAHYRHFAIEVSLAQPSMQHAVGFHLQRPLQVGIAGGKGFEIIGAIKPGGGVGHHRPPRKFAIDIGIFRRALEQQVLQQVRHAGFAVVFVARAHQISDVDGGRGFARIGCQQHAQAIAQTIFANAFHLRHRRQGCGRYRPPKQQQQGKTQAT